MSRFYSFLPMLILIIFSSLVNGKSKNKKAASSQAGASPQRDYGQEKAGRDKAPRARRSLSVADAVHWRTAREEECAYGEVNHRYSHNSDRRVAQLNSYLKAGLIDKKEYAQMLERYRRMDREAGLD